MRHILLSCAILLLALSFCLFSMLHIREIGKQALCALTSAQEQAQVYDFEACRASMQQANRCAVALNKHVCRIVVVLVSSDARNAEDIR